MSKLRLLFRNDVFVTLFLSVGWQLVLLTIGIVLAPQQGLFGHMNHWDAGWYLHIIQSAYGLEGSPAAPAFYPLFPLIIGVLNTLTFGLIPLLALALIMNTAALWAALLALTRILKHFKVSKWGSLIGVAAFLAFPSAFFLHAFYSEALFIAVAFWAYYFTLKKKWWAVGTLLAVLTAARLPSLLFVALCGLEYLRTYDWSIKKALNKKILWFLLAPLGLLAYGLYLLTVRGSFFAMFQAYSTTTDWTYQVFNPNIFATLFETTAKISTSFIGGGFNYEIFVNYALPLASIVAILVASIFILYKLRKDGIPLFVFGILSVVLFTLNSNVVSVHRYALACVVIYIAIALFVTKRNRWIIPLCFALAISFCVQLFLYTKFIHDIFAG